MNRSVTHEHRIHNQERHGKKGHAEIYQFDMSRVCIELCGKVVISIDEFPRANLIHDLKEEFLIVPKLVLLRPADEIPSELTIAARMVLKAFLDFQFVYCTYKDLRKTQLQTGVHS